MAFSNGPTIVRDGLVLALDASDRNSYLGSGTTWTDISGNGNNGTLTNGPTFNSGNGGSIVFDGVDDYAITGNFPSCANWSTEMFLYPTVFTTSQKVILDVNVGIRFEINNGKFNSHFGNGSSWIYTFLPSTTTFAANTWYHVVVTVQSGGQAKIYVNSVLENTTNIGSGTTPNIPLYIARYTGATGYEFSGRVGVTRIYNKSLSQLEILQNYNATKTRFGLK